MTSYKTNIRGIACTIIYLVNLEVENEKSLLN